MPGTRANLDQSAKVLEYEGNFELYERPAENGTVTVALFRKTKRKTPENEYNCVRICIRDLVEDTTYTESPIL